MAGTGRKWAIGCGIGCGAFVLIMALVIGGGIFAGKRIADRVDGVEESFDAMKARFGNPESYTPPLDGRVPAGRMEAFFAAREAMAPERLTLDETFAVLDGERGNIVNKIRSGLQLIPSLMDFVEHRNVALTEAGMGLGEYQYIYTMLAFAVLHVDPADGPGFSLVSDEEKQEDGGWRFRTNDDDSEEEVRERRAREVRRTVNRFQVRINENHLAAFATDPAEPAGLDRDAWRAQLEAEQESLKSERLKLLWEDGLPDHLSEHYDYYRSRFEESYDPMTSILELGLTNFDD
jgi:hypothetical protein